METLKISSPAFVNNTEIPAKYTCDGEDVNPPILIENVPHGTKSLALIIEDPDAPSGLWTHWIVWNINPNQREISENSTPRESVAGKNSFHRNSYGGPCPPSGRHRYFFKIFALNTILDLAGSEGRGALEKAMEQHVLAQASLIGLYGKK